MAAAPKGAERIAASWADNRKVPQIAFKPDWTKHAKAAPFKRNDQMLDVLPIGVIVFPGIGHLGQPCRQGAKARHSRVEIRRGRRMSAAVDFLIKRGFETLARRSRTQCGSNKAPRRGGCHTMARSKSMMIFASSERQSISRGVAFEVIFASARS